MSFGNGEYRMDLVTRPGPESIILGKAWHELAWLGFDAPMVEAADVTSPKCIGVDFYMSEEDLAGDYMESIFKPAWTMLVQNLIRKNPGYKLSGVSCRPAVRDDGKPCVRLDIGWGVK